jgi:hypothetical protein
MFRPLQFNASFCQQWDPKTFNDTSTVPVWYHKGFGFKPFDEQVKALPCPLPLDYCLGSTKA